MDIMLVCFLYFVLSGIALILIAEIIIRILECFFENEKQEIDKKQLRKKNTCNKIFIAFPELSYKNDFIIQYKEIEKEISSLQEKIETVEIVENEV